MSLAFEEADVLELGGPTARRAVTSGDRWTELGFLPGGLVAHRLDHLESLVVTKLAIGFDTATMSTITDLVQDVAAGRFGPLKFLILDFAHPASGISRAGEGFPELVAEMANLILDAPVVSVGWVRSEMAGADLEFALACSMIVAEEGTRFDFTADPVDALGAYGLLAQKIGFARAERLMEGGEVLEVKAMRELLLVKDVAERGAGFAGIESFLRKRVRRHNASYGIYRAQRIAMPVTAEQRGGTGRRA